MLTADALATAIREHPLVVEQALGFLGEAAGNYNLDGIEAAAALRGVNTADMLLSLLGDMGQTEAFAIMLRARNVALAECAGVAIAPPVAPPADNHAAFGPVDEAGVELDALGQFVFRAKAFRCRILIGGAIMGSGAFVSPRLVLTAAHVVQELEPAQRLEVLAEDGRRYAGRLEWISPCHDDERHGALPPLSAADTHADTALIKVLHPVGQRLARIVLPERLDPDWIGTRHLFLVHFPQGEDRGGAFGRVLRAPGDLRLVHDIATDPGSSGGPGFDRALRFVGLHQGRLPGNGSRRLVPYDRFGAHAGFRRAIEADGSLRSLWSLDGSPEGHLILGRNLFIDAVRAMALGEAPMLAGLWVRRSNAARDTGMLFSYRILKALLKLLGCPADVTLVATEHATQDIIASIDRLSGGMPSQARPGVRADETTLAASDGDRAAALMDRLAGLSAAGRQQWLFFENPPEGLGQRAQFQLEHLVRLSLRHPGVNVVLAGYETYGLVDTRFESLDDALTSSRPGLLLEILADTPLAEIRATFSEACRDTGLDWSPDIIRHEVEQALAGLPHPAGRLAAEHLETVAQRLAETLRRRLAS